MRSYHKLWLVCLLATAAAGRDKHDWESLSQLHQGDRVRVVLKTGPVEGEFQTWTPQEVTVATVTAKRDEVVKIERYRHAASRGKRATIGALIGFGGGFAGGRHRTCVSVLERAFRVPRRAWLWDAQAR